MSSFDNFGYMFLFLYSLGGGMIALITAAAFAASGKMSILLVIFIAIIGNFIGDELLFFSSRYCKSEIMPYIKSHRRKIAFTELMFKKYGSFFLILKKYVYGIKTIVPIALAITKFNAIKFSILNFIGAVIWGISVGLISFYFTDFIKDVMDLKHKNLYILIIVLSICFVVFFIYKKNAKAR